MALSEVQPELGFESIVLATDFSANSKVAGEYAGRLAHHYGADLVVAHAYVATSAAMSVEAEGRLSVQRGSLEHELTTLAHKLAPQGTRVRTVLREGTPEELALELATSQSSPLLVLGTQGRGRIEHHVLGSSAEAILRAVACPVLTVGPQVKHSVGSGLDFHNILYATDFSREAMHAAEYAVTLAQSHGSNLHVLHAVPAEVIKHPERLKEMQKKLFHDLDQIVPESARQFCTARSFVAVGEARQQILEHVREHHIGLIVLGVHRSTQFEMRFQMRLTYRLITESPCPVLTIRG